MAIRNTIKIKFGKGFFQEIFVLMLTLLTGCSFFDSLQGNSNVNPQLPSSQGESLPSNTSTSLGSSESSSPVSVKPLSDPKKLTDVSLELRLPDAPIEFLIINYGTSKTNLNNHKKISKESLILVDEKDRLYRFILRDAGELRPLFANIVTQAGEFTSDPSETFEVTE
jgi:hypothetical protein